jgi:hypothetical protein
LLDQIGPGGSPQHVHSEMATPLNVMQVQKAVDALLNHTKISKGKNQLFEDQTPINIVFAFKKMPSTQGRVKAHMM